MISDRLVSWDWLQHGLGAVVVQVDEKLPLILLVIAAVVRLRVGVSMVPSHARKIAAAAFATTLLGYVCSVARVDGTNRQDLDPLSNLLGHLPWSDARGYYEGAERFLSGIDIGNFAARRSVNTGWLAARIWATGSLAGATVVQVAFAGLATAYLAWSAARLLGVASGLAAWALTYAEIRQYFTTTLSEPPGLTLATIGAGLFLAHARTPSKLWGLTGLFAFGLAEAFRSGAPVLPLLAAVALGIPRSTTWLGAIVAFASGLFLNPALNAIYDVRSGGAGSNTAYTIAGLSLGGDWKVAEKHYQSETSLLADEKDISRLLYGKALENIRADPRPLIQALVQGTTHFLKQAPRFAAALTETAPYGTIAFLALMGFLFVSRNALPAWSARLAIACFLGLLSSVPIVFPGGGFRVLSGTAPFVIVLAALCFAARTEPGEGHSPENWIAVMALGSVCFSLAIAALIRGSERPPCGSAIADDLLVVRNPRRGPIVAIGDLPRNSVVPLLTLANARAQLALADNPVLLDTPPFVLYWALDQRTGSVMTLVGPPSLISVGSDWIWVNSEPWGSSSHRRIRDFGPWNPCTASPSPTQTP